MDFIKSLISENENLKKENAKLKEKLEKQSKNNSNKNYKSSTCACCDNTAMELIYATEIDEW